MRLSLTTTITIATTIGFLALLPVSSSYAQSNTQNPGASSYSSAAAPNPQSIDDATLQRTARAFMKVSKITENEKSTENSASDDSSKMQAAKQAESEKLAAVKQEGLEPQQYNQVLQLVQNDSNLQHRFLSLVKTSGEGSPSGDM